MPDSAPAEIEIIPPFADGVTDGAHTKTPTLLETTVFELPVSAPENVAEVPAATDAPAPIDVAVPTEAPVPTDAPTPTAAPEPTPAPTQPPLAYEDFKLPEGLTIANPERMGTFKEMLGKHQVPQEVAQSLLELHAQVLKESLDAYQAQVIPAAKEELQRKLQIETVANQHKQFNETRKNWRDAVAADEQIGGAGHQTAMQAIARTRDLLVPADQRAEFDNFLRTTGAGDHPAFLRLLHRASQYLDEPPPPKVIGSPVPQQQQKQTFSDFYTHPTSRRQSQR